MTSSLKIGYLIPLSETLEENTAFPRVPIYKGVNLIGRNALSLTDKRISRKHLTLTAYNNGSASLFMEGSNPIVINTGKERKKIYSQEKAELRSGCVLELIPGLHLFKYEELGIDRNVCTEHSNRKRAREESQGDAGWDSQTKKEVSDMEAIHHFNIPREKLPLTYRLLRVQDLPSWANTSAVSLDDVIQGDIVVALLSNYMVDIDWLMHSCPTLLKVPHVLVVHGEGDMTLNHMKKRKPVNWILHKPPLPISYGTHHSKALILIYPSGIRVIVHTANLIYVDWNNKSQGLWMQDFPWKDHNSPKKGGGFEDDLVDYLTALKLPEFNVKVPSVGEFTINSSFFRKFDYRDATVRLIASVPGYHKGPNLKKWGHMKLRSVLQEYIFDKEFQKAPLVYQFSSLGSLDEKWMAELAASMSAGCSEDKEPLGLGIPLIVWPTVEDVRNSLEGYAAGNAIPSPLKNVEKEFLKKYWAKWKATHTGRCRAMPHVKTYARYKGQKLAWFLLTSANLSKAAWGALQKNNSQLMIRSYELGVLFLPSFMRRGHIFSCTNEGNTSLKDMRMPPERSEVKRTKLVTLMGLEHGKTNMSMEIIPLPVPYELPPEPYSSEDIPWSWDRKYSKKDIYGQVWPRMIQLYESLD
ncbi:hypothetical protein SAY87_002501 [Trapa incisa]|uniref:FHA domain-containing protein n=1 Tax=Trapa incisa TaxID=236973 RepID=A0AAN7PUC1_9MYRT|nr:hypothetical protein SAY87_002501 [Trapa incisa]